MRLLIDGDYEEEHFFDYTTEFISSGLKSYGYITKFGEIYLKIKEFTLNHFISKTINFQNLKSLIFHFVYPNKNPLPPELKVSQSLSVLFPHKITRDRINFKLCNSELNKTFKVTFGKRQLLLDGSFETQPFGN